MPIRREKKVYPANVTAIVISIYRLNGTTEAVVEYQCSESYLPSLSLFRFLVWHSLFHSMQFLMMETEQKQMTYSFPCNPRLVAINCVSLVLYCGSVLLCDAVHFSFPFAVGVECVKSPFTFHKIIFICRNFPFFFLSFCLFVRVDGRKSNLCHTLQLLRLRRSAAY